MPNSNVPPFSLAPGAAARQLLADLLLAGCIACIIAVVSQGWVAKVTTQAEQAEGWRALVEAATQPVLLVDSRSSRVVDANQLARHALPDVNHHRVIVTARGEDLPPGDMQPAVVAFAGKEYAAVALATRGSVVVLVLGDTVQPLNLLGLASHKR